MFLNALAYNVILHVAGQQSRISGDTSVQCFSSAPQKCAIHVCLNCKQTKQLLISVMHASFLKFDKLCEYLWKHFIICCNKKSLGYWTNFTCMKKRITSITTTQFFKNGPRMNFHSQQGNFMFQFLEENGYLKNNHIFDVVIKLLYRLLFPKSRLKTQSQYLLVSNMSLHTRRGIH